MFLLCEEKRQNTEEPPFTKQSYIFILRKTRMSTNETKRFILEMRDEV
jgi:hypothetical protein